MILIYLPSLHPQSAFVQGFVKGVMVHRAEIVSEPAWLPFLNIVAIAGVQALHAFSAILVLQCFRRRQIRWLWYSMAFHSSFDLLVFSAAVYHVSGSEPSFRSAAQSYACIFFLDSETRNPNHNWSWRLAERMALELGE